MVINQVYSDYFQKSKTFLLPVLGIERGDHTVDMMTFIEWKNKYMTSDKKLIVVKQVGSSPEGYKSFESKFLLKSPYFETIFQLNDGHVVYLFNLESIKSDFKHFINGKYSLLSVGLKDRIRDYFGENSVEWIYIKSYLYPAEYFEEYAELLNVHVEQIREVGQLCDKYNPKLECLSLVGKAASKRSPARRKKAVSK